MQMADQLVYTPLIYFPCYFVAAAVMRGRSARPWAGSPRQPPSDVREEHNNQTRLKQCNFLYKNMK